MDLRLDALQEVVRARHTIHYPTASANAESRLTFYSTDVAYLIKQRHFIPGLSSFDSGRSAFFLVMVREKNGTT